MSDRSVLLVVSGNTYPADQWDHHTARIWFELLKGFDELHVFARAQDQRFHTVSRAKLTLHLIPRGPARMLTFVISSWWLWMVAKKVQPTHVVAQSATHGGLAAVTLGRSGRWPVFVEVHGEYYLAASASSPLVYRFFYKPVAGWVMRRASRIRSLSPQMTEELGAVYGRAILNKVAEVPNRVDLMVFSPPKQDHASDGMLRVVSVGALNVNKNHRQLMRDLVAGTTPCELTVVGEGPEQEHLRREAAELGFSLHLPGRLTHPELAAVLRNQDVYVHYARSEAVPRSVLEAMAIGLPVVVTPVGYTGGIVVTGETGLRLGEGEAGTLENALIILQDHAAREHLGRNARRRVEQHHEWITTFELYRKAIFEMPR